jgi:hypothetical protein
VRQRIPKLVFAAADAVQHSAFVIRHSSFPHIRVIHGGLSAATL